MSLPTLIKCVLFLVHPIRRGCAEHQCFRFQLGNLISHLLGSHLEILSLCIMLLIWWYWYWHGLILDTFLYELSVIAPFFLWTFSFFVYHIDKSLAPLVLSLLAEWMGKSKKRLGCWLVVEEVLSLLQYYGLPHMDQIHDNTFSLTIVPFNTGVTLASWLPADTHWKLFIISDI